MAPKDKIAGRSVTLRPARPECGQHKGPPRGPYVLPRLMHFCSGPPTHFYSGVDIARRLYCITHRPIVERLFGWDAAREGARFDREFTVEEAQIIEIGSNAIGWLQAGEDEGMVRLKQICIDRAFQRRGIGTKLLRELIASADARRLPMELTVARINPAVGLYARLGFNVVDSNDYEFTMRREAAAGG
ncbi:MAG: GNAT family N-acetyltransferase [Alphaproteobacteria bacterium]|nr:GNAT family N-acetyltransferase [Alphaproteobacteria bacterium]